MWADSDEDGASPGEDRGNLSLMRIILVIFFGGIAAALLGAVYVRDRSKPVRRKIGRLLTVEEAVRLRPE
jgi:hypothetical protein